MKIETIDKYSKSISVGIFVNVGSAHENSSEKGIAHFIEHMLFKGTTKRSYKRIAQDMDKLGGIINAFTSKEYTCFFVKILREYLTDAFDVLSDIICNPIMDENELNKEKGVIIEEINMSEDNPDESVYDTFMQNAITTSISYPILGTKAHIESYTRKDLLKFMGKHYKLDNMIIAAVGLNASKFNFDLIHNGFSYKDYFTETENKTISFGFKKGVDIIKRNLNATNVVLGCELFGRHDERKYAASILNDIIGGTMSSKLFQKIREELSLCYHISSSTNLYNDGGLLSIFSATSHNTTQKLIDGIKHELEMLKKDYITNEELKDAKTHFKGNYALYLESNSSVMMKLGADNILYGQYIDENEVINKVDNLKLDDIVEVINLIDLDNFHVTALGNIENIIW